MRETRILPEKITHPFQLMAAWFVMLILLVGILLTAAANLREPAWAAGFLVISSIAFSVLVTSAVFLMLTKFRPHLQEPKEYAEWLRDERRYQGQPIQQLEIRDIEEIQQPSAVSLLSDIDDPELFRDIVTTPVEISYLKANDKVLEALRKLGFMADIYKPPFETHGEIREFLPKSEHTSIWIGSRVQPKVALLAIKTVICIWPHLKYMDLSSDTRGAPDYIHNQMFFGGATCIAKGKGLKPWQKEEIEAISENIGKREFHALVRAKYT